MSLKEYYKGSITYSKVDVLGKGQYGQVIKAKDTQGNFYAIKIVNPSAYNSQSLKYLDSEREILQFLTTHPKHHNLVTFYETISENELVFEYCNSQSLAEYLSRNKYYISIDEQQLKIILAQLVNGLSYLHGLGIVHRDIKPDNILVSVVAGKTCLKLSDFGFAVSPKTDMLKSNVGTPIFKAHEVGKGGYDEKADIFSLAASFYSIAMPKGEVEYIRANARFALQPDKIANLSKSDDYKDLLIKMSCEDQTNRISLNDIKNHPFLLSRTVNLCVFSSTYTQLPITVSQAIDITLERKYPNLDLDEYIILCSYLGSKEIFPPRNDDKFYPIYTIENVILVSVKHKIQFPKIPLILTSGKDIASTVQSYKVKVEDCYNLLKYFQYIQNFLSIYQVVHDVYLHHLNKLNLASTLQILHKNMEKYKLSFEILRNLKEMDENGADTNTLLIDRLPSYIKSFINQSSVFQYDSLIKDKNIIENNYTQFKALRDKIHFNSVEFSITDLLLTLERILKGLNEIMIINDLENSLVHTVFSIIQPFHTSFIVQKANFENVLTNFTFLLRSFEHIQFLDQYKASTLQKDNDLCLEISKIPHYYTVTKNELKRRYLWNSEFNKLCSQYARNIQNYIEKDSNTKNQFNKTIHNSNVYQPKQQNLAKEPVTNPLNMYLTNNEDEDGFVIVDGKIYVDNDQTTMKQVDKVQTQHINYIKNHPINPINYVHKTNDAIDITPTTTTTTTPVVTSPIPKEKKIITVQKIVVKEIEKLTSESKLIIDNLLQQNQELESEVSSFQSRKQYFDELEAIYKSLCEEIAPLAEKHSELKEKINLMTKPYDGDVIDPNTGLPMDLQSRMDLKKLEISEINQKKENYQQYINDFLNNQNQLIQTYEQNRILYEASKKTIQDYQIQINHCRENEAVQFNTLNKTFNNERESFQRQCAFKNDSIRKLKQLIKDEESKLLNLDNVENDKKQFDNLQKTLKERDNEIESLIAKLNDLEKIARNLDQ